MAALIERQSEWAVDLRYLIANYVGALDPPQAEIPKVAHKWFFAANKKVTGLAPIQWQRGSENELECGECSTIEADDVHFWRLYVPQVEKADALVWDLLSDDERERGNRLILATRQADFVIMRAWLRRVLSRYAGVSSSELRFVYNEHGRPALANVENLSFNLSHSERWALLALRRSGAIGVDLEYCRPGRAFSAIATRFFTESELAWLQTHGNEVDYCRAFYAIWSRKEAYLKALGTGLSLSPLAFCCDHADPALRIVECQKEWQHTLTWRLFDLSGWSDYRAALCWEGELGGILAFETVHEPKSRGSR